MAEATTSSRRVESAERRRRALQLRVAGYGFEQIARTPRGKNDPRPMYSSRQRAHEAVKKAMDELREETQGAAEELRQLELERLDTMHRALWPSVQPSRPVLCDCGCGHTMWREPDHEAVDRVVKLMERRAKMLGLDVKSVEQDHSKASSMILSIMDALDGAASFDFETGAPLEDAPPPLDEVPADAGADL